MNMGCEEVEITYRNHSILETLRDLQVIGVDKYIFDGENIPKANFYSALHIARNFEGQKVLLVGDENGKLNKMLEQEGVTGKTVVDITDIRLCSSAFLNAFGVVVFETPTTCFDVEKGYGISMVLYKYKEHTIYKSILNNCNKPMIIVRDYIEDRVHTDEMLNFVSVTYSANHNEPAGVLY